MKKFMFEIDPDDINGSIQKLAASGYDGVILNGRSHDAFAAAKRAGMEAWIYYGAHSLPEGDAELLAQDAFGRPVRWFGSACPNADELNLRHMSAAIDLAAKVGADGVFVDGARFASFASTEGKESFFSCFCPRCMSKMEKLGYDPHAVRKGIAMLMSVLNGGDGDIVVLRRSIENWLNFRADCVREYMERFSAMAHSRGLSAGAFVFAPSLWWFVGQTANSCASLDVVSPMLYRAYPHPDGTACLSHEWAGFMELLSGTRFPAGNLAAALFDISFISDDPMAGFSPEHVGLETEAARKQLPGRVKLLPIIQTEDDRLDATAACVMGAGADGYGEFMYSQKRF